MSYDACISVPLLKPPKMILSRYDYSSIRLAWPPAKFLVIKYTLFWEYTDKASKKQSKKVDITTIARTTFIHTITDLPPYTTVTMWHTTTNVLSQTSTKSDTITIRTAQKSENFRASQNRCTVMHLAFLFQNQINQRW